MVRIESSCNEDMGNVVLLLCSCQYSFRDSSEKWIKINVKLIAIINNNMQSQIMPQSLDSLKNFRWSMIQFFTIFI